MTTARSLAAGGRSPGRLYLHVLGNDKDCLEAVNLLAT